MKVSALIPTYNRRAQVQRAIESVLAQTLPVAEIIVVDDGSTDGTADAIRTQYGSQVALIEQKNAGAAAARNRGIREAQSEWVAFLDSDDVWLSTKIERQIEALKALGGEFGLCFTDCVYEGNPEKKLSVFQETGLEDVPKFGTLEDPARYVLNSREPFWTQSLLVRRSLLEEIKGFDERLPVREDTDVLFRLSFRTRFCFVAGPLVRIDRTPSRDGLCNLYLTKDGRIYDCLEKLYSKWLSLPEVRGADYERPVRELLRAVHLESTEFNIRRFRMGRALRQIRRLRAMGDSYTSLVTTLAQRKIAKLRRDLSAPIT